MKMPRNNTTPRPVSGRAVRKSTGRRKPIVGKAGGRAAAVQQAQPQQQPEKLPEKQPEQQPQQQVSPTAWQEPLDADYELDEKAEWEDAIQAAQDASKTRQRIEMLREERLLQQALIDTFDL
jgi:hypothetical protein